MTTAIALFVAIAAAVGVAGSIADPQKPVEIGYLVPPAPPGPPLGPLGVTINMEYTGREPLR